MFANFYHFIYSYLVLFTHDIQRLLLLCVGGGFVGILAGRGRMIVCLLTTYLTLALVTNAPWIAFLQIRIPVLRTPYAGVIWFIVLYVCILWVLWRSRVLDGLMEDHGSWWESVLFGCFQIGSFLSCWLLLLPNPSQNGTGSAMLFHWFGTSAARSFWLTAPFLYLTFRVWTGSVRSHPHTFQEEDDL